MTGSPHAIFLFGMVIRTRNRAISFNSQNHENVLSIVSSLLEWHLCFSREVNLLWRTLSVVLRVTSFACKAVQTTWSSPWNSPHTSKQTMKWRAFSWNHRPDASMVYFHYGSLNSVKAFMLAGRETCECICSCVLFFFLLFPRLWEVFNWQIQEPPISPGISSFLNLRRQLIFAGFLSTTNKLASLQESRQVSKHRPYWFVFSCRCWETNYCNLQAIPYCKLNYFSNTTMP